MPFFCIWINQNKVGGKKQPQINLMDYINQECVWMLFSPSQTEAFSVTCSTKYRRSHEEKIISISFNWSFKLLYIQYILLCFLYFPLQAHYKFQFDGWFQLMASEVVHSTSLIYSKIKKTRDISWLWAFILWISRAFSNL